MSEHEPERDPLADAPDVTPDPDGTEPGDEADIPEDELPVPEHPTEAI